MRFDELGLKEAVLEAVTESGYDTPTPIQAQAIPLVLEGRDVIGASQTGTGKTAAFALPSLSKIEPIGKPQILVLEPTGNWPTRSPSNFFITASTPAAR